MNAFFFSPTCLLWTSTMLFLPAWRSHQTATSWVNQYWTSSIWKVFTSTPASLTWREHDSGERKTGPLHISPLPVKTLKEEKVSRFLLYATTESVVSLFLPMVRLGESAVPTWSASWTLASCWRSTQGLLRTGRWEVWATGLVLSLMSVFYNPHVVIFYVGVISFVLVLSLMCE